MSRKTVDANDDSVRIIKKYPNRRLYDTVSSSYVALADIKQLVMTHVPFAVRDAKTGEEIWKVANGDPKIAETGTSAPYVVKDKVIVGISGGEFGAVVGIVIGEFGPAELAGTAFFSVAEEAYGKIGVGTRSAATNGSAEVFGPELSEA